MKAAQLAPWLTLAAAILAAGMWLGGLQQQTRSNTERISNLESEQHYLHGAITVPRQP